MVACTGILISTSSAGGCRAVITIEKVAFLRALPLFAGIPDHILAAIAHITDEVILEPNSTLIEEQALGDCLYLIAEGEVRVHTGGRTIVNLSSGKTVGELALLDREPRAASVTTLTHCVLLRLSKEPFDEVMADRPEIAQSVIRALCQQVRDLGRVIAARAESIA
jgi:CRP-like cAMP-binding protein